MWKVVLSCAALTVPSTGGAVAAVDCGARPDLVPTKSSEAFVADASGKAQLLSKFLPQADIKGQVKAWRSEEHQNYKSLDQQQKDLYFQWISCQNIMSSSSMTEEQKQKQWREILSAMRDPVAYKTCALPEFGLERWNSKIEQGGNSGWIGGGHSQQEFCGNLAGQMITHNQAGPLHNVTTLSSSEDSRKDFFGHVEYNYGCNIRLEWNPIYKSRADALCGISSAN